MNIMLTSNSIHDPMYMHDAGESIIFQSINQVRDTTEEQDNLKAYFPNSRGTKHLFRAALNPAHCLHSILPPKKNMYGCNLKKKGHGRELPLAKTKLYKDRFLIRCIYKYV